MFFVPRISSIRSSIHLTVLLCLSVVLSRKCEEKCKEYAELVYEKEEAPVLGTGPVFHRVSRCSIVETPLIIGGTRASHSEFPHMAAIGFGINSSDISWQCGGSIISDSFILTAAHCLRSANKPPTKVRVGTTNLEEPDNTMQERNVVEVFKHPEYQVPVQYHDIGLLRLEKPLDLNPAVRPACLEVQHQPAEQAVTACGFGKTDYYSNKVSKHLMKVQLNYVSEEDCKRAFALDIGGRRLPDGWIPSMLCAGVMEGGKDTCQGDSGGPLQRVLENPYCMYSVVGITSWGKFCGFQDTPAIYTRVSSYLDWIESIVWSSERSPPELNLTSNFDVGNKNQRSNKDYGFEKD